MCQKIIRVRPKDIVLNYGLAPEAGKLTYYMMNSDKINSFSAEEVKEYVKLGYQVIGTKSLSVVTINQILRKYGKVHFLSIDVEGLDFAILKSLDYENFAPICICVETCEHGGLKRDDFEELNTFLGDKGYMVYADTMLNTIYVNKKRYIETRKRIC